MNLVTDYGQQTRKVRGRLYFQRRVIIKCSRLLLRDGRLYCWSWWLTDTMAKLNITLFLAPHGWRWCNNAILYHWFNCSALFYIAPLLENAEKGGYIGSPCEFTCSKRLHHVFCDPTTNECTCEKHYPVVIGATKGCAKRKFFLGASCHPQVL